MTATIPSLLQPLKDRLAAATPGPWTDALGKTFKAVGSIADARLIVNAPTDQAKLIAAIEAVVALHKPGGGYFASDVACHYCSNSIGYVLYPCSTVAALTQPECQHQTRSDT